MPNLYDHNVLRQIYDFIVEREGFEKLTPYNQAMEFFKELSQGDQSDVIQTEPNILYGKFGSISKINLRLVPLFREKDKFLKWAYEQLN